MPSHRLPQVDEMDAVWEEYEHLLREIKALEKDRVQLEEMFHEAGRIEAQKRLEERRTYRGFRTNWRYMTGDDLRTMPATWLEDVPLPPPDGTANGGTRSRRRPDAGELDGALRSAIRRHRGAGLALLIADPQCKTSLLSKCFRNGGRRGPSHGSLKRELAATAIDGGAEHLRHCAITGFSDARDDGERAAADGDDGGSVPDATQGGTAYFLKFDGGRAHLRGHLPSNLADRLASSGRDAGTIAYLSVGRARAAVATAGGGDSSGGRRRRPYYAEFDDGECWWGTNDDAVLDRTFSEMDVHRVAFGAGPSSWIVLGKDGGVRWRDVPQGLHDALEARRTHGGGSGSSASAAPCEVSLGVGGTYFVRFLDGTVDYSLPNFVADVFDRFEGGGRSIRDVALHVDTYDALIRYSYVLSDSQETTRAIEQKE
ncbi:hypothetical protein ACHAWF_008137 [Thalassiosira exigua]